MADASLFTRQEVASQGLRRCVRSPVSFDDKVRKKKKFSAVNLSVVFLCGCSEFVASPMCMINL